MYRLSRDQNEPLWAIRAALHIALIAPSSVPLPPPHTKAITTDRPPLPDLPNKGECPTIVIENYSPRQSQSSPRAFPRFLRCKDRKKHLVPHLFRNLRPRVRNRNVHTIPIGARRDANRPSRVRIFLYVVNLRAVFTNRTAENANSFFLQLRQPRCYTAPIVRDTAIVSTVNIQFIGPARVDQLPTLVAYALLLSAPISGRSALRGS
jgi:hypothetical protein